MSDSQLKVPQPKYDTNDAMNALYSSIESLEALFVDIKNSFKRFRENYSGPDITCCGKPLEEFLVGLIDEIEPRLKAAEVELYEREAIFLLKEYALEEDDKLTESARVLKWQLQEIAKRSIQDSSPKTILQEIETQRKRLNHATLSPDGDHAVDKDYVKGVLDDIQKAVVDSVYFDGRAHVMSVLQDIDGYLVRRLQDMSSLEYISGRPGEYGKDDINATEESYLLRRIRQELDTLLKTMETQTHDNPDIQDAYKV